MSNHPSPSLFRTLSSPLCITHRHTISVVLPLMCTLAAIAVFVSHHHNNCLKDIQGEGGGEKEKPKWISLTQFDLEMVRIADGSRSLRVGAVRVNERQAGCRWLGVKGEGVCDVRLERLGREGDLSERGRYTVWCHTWWVLNSNYCFGFFLHVCLVHAVGKAVCLIKFCHN